MPPEVVFRPSAKEDLGAIALHIAAESGVNRAFAFVDRIEQRCLALGRFPRAGRDRSDVIRGLKMIAFEKRVVVIYLVGMERVEIVRVAYGGRDVEALLRSMG